MSYGTAFSSPLPTPGVTPSPTFEAQLIAWAQEAEAKLEQKVGQADLAVTSGDLATHGTRIVELPAAGGTAADGATYDVAGGYWLANGAADTVVLPLPVQPGQRITSVSCHGRTGSTTAWTLTVHKIDKATGTVTQLGTVSSGIIAATIEKKSIALTETVVADVGYFLKWSSGANLDRFLGARFEVDRV